MRNTDTTSRGLSAPAATVTLTARSCRAAGVHMQATRMRGMRMAGMCMAPSAQSMR